MIDVDPFVRHMILCDAVVPVSLDPLKVNIEGLISHIRVPADATFPVVHPELCVYLLVAGGRGTGRAQIVVVAADGDEPVFAGPVREIAYGGDPLKVRGLKFRVLDCPFPRRGLYWVQFHHNGRLLEKQPLLVR